jgi:hypothetical protein
VGLFYLHQNSELFFDGDAGTTVPGPSSQRTGIEFNNNYQPVPWCAGLFLHERTQFLTACCTAR